MYAFTQNFWKMIQTLSLAKYTRKFVCFISVAIMYGLFYAILQHLHTLIDCTWNGIYACLLVMFIEYLYWHFCANAKQLRLCLLSILLCNFNTHFETSIIFTTVWEYEKTFDWAEPNELKFNWHSSWMYKVVESS